MHVCGECVSESPQSHQAHGSEHCREEEGNDEEVDGQGGDEEERYQHRHHYITRKKHYGTPAGTHKKNIAIDVIQRMLQRTDKKFDLNRGESRYLAIINHDWGSHLVRNDP